MDILGGASVGTFRPLGPHMITRAVTLQQVAKEVGVSVTSVSDILQRGQRGRYRSDTVERVDEAARRMGYQPHAAGRLLRQRNSKLVGIAVRTAVLGRETVNALVVAMEAELISRGFQPILIDPAQMVPSNGAAAFPGPGLLAGIISADLAMETDVPDFYNALRNRLPIVALYPLQSGEVDYVTTDRARAIEIAVDHLVGLGHRRIAFAETIWLNGVTSGPKLRGWRHAVKKWRLDVPAGYEIALPDHGRVSELGQDVARVWPTLDPAPTALVCASDEIALSSIRYLTALGLRLPDDLSITGYNGGTQGEFCYPALTTIAPPAANIARVAADRLIQLLEFSEKGEGWQPEQRMLEPALLLRESTIPLKMDAARGLP